MKSVYLDNLNRDINTTSNLIDKCCLRAERAGYCARLGDLENAIREVQDIKEINLTLRSGKISISAGIADGLCKYYGGEDRDAYESLKRARALSVGLNQRNYIAKSSCWLAFIEYGSQSFERMFHFMNESVANNTEPEDASTSARLALLVAQTLHLGNRFDLAVDWYKIAHTYAIRASDGASISALMHNMAAIWTANTRNEVLGGIKTKDSGRIAFAGAISTLNFDNLVGGSSFDFFNSLMLAQLHSLEGNWAEALHHYKERIDGIRLHAARGWQVWMLSDFGWCLLKLGHVNEAQSYIDMAKTTVENDQHPDDQAATYRRLADFSTEIGKSEDADEFRLLSDLKWLEYSSMQQNQVDKSIEFSETKRSFFDSNFK